MRNDGNTAAIANPTFFWDTLYATAAVLNPAESPSGQICKCSSVLTDVGNFLKNVCR